LGVHDVDAVHLSEVSATDVAGAMQLTLPFELVPQLVLPEFDLLPTDQIIKDAYSPLRNYRNDVRAYISLIDLSQRCGKRINEYVWRVQVGYGILVPASGCSTRALERAWARLELLSYVLRYPKGHDGKVPTTYWVRTLEGMMAMFEGAGCTHFRVLRGKRIQLFRPKAIGKSK
jgi:hypothetical protein